MLNRTMPDALEAVKTRMEELKWSAYKLVQELNGKVPAATVYEFLRGESAINSRALGHIMDAIGLEFVARRKGK